MGKLKDGAKYAVLAAAYQGEGIQEGTALKRDGVGAYRTKTVRAGEFMYISCYPLINAKADKMQRERLAGFLATVKGGGSKDLNFAARANLIAKYNKYNNSRRIREFEQMVHANFEKDDLHVCCTYAMQDYENYGEVRHRDREEARKEIRNWLNRVKRLLRRHGCDLSGFRWICCSVTKTSLKETDRPRPDTHHHHLLVHGVPLELRTEIERLWPFGTCNADRLQDSSDGFAGMSGYIARQENSANGENAGRRSFTTSRNIIRPKVTTNDSKISRRRVSMIAADVQAFGREIFEKIFPGFRVVEPPKVKLSDFVAGAYIYAKLRRKRSTEGRFGTRQSRG